MLESSLIDVERRPQDPVRVESRPGQAEPSQSSRPRILMLDDDPFMLDIHSRILRAMGYGPILQANNAEAALTLLRDPVERVDLIICDLNMPRMDGIEFLQILDRTDDFRGSIVLLSGEGVRIMHSVQKLLGSGGLLILGALEKPAGHDAFRAVLQRWKPIGAQPPGIARPSYTEAEFDRAISDPQWILHYQPKVDLRTGELSGVEALIRWMHPTLGLIGPDDFIARAEDCGAIDSLTDWVLRKAMTQMVEWRRGGFRIQMAINLSMKSLRTPQFARRIQAIAREIGASPHDLVLEITESRLMEQTAVPLESLVRLRMQRFGLSIDDFGTGHSSLVQLRDVPFTELKIDRGFVQGARRNQITRPILEGSLGLAKRLGMRSVAEGVETVDDWRLLCELGCDLAQGWFIGRAIPAEQMIDWATGWRVRSAQLKRS